MDSGALGSRIKKKIKPMMEIGRIGLNFISSPYIYRRWFAQHSKRLLRFRNIHKGEDCFIIGNGPSLNKMDLSLLNKYFTFGLNKIHLIFDKVDLKLDYHVAVNPLVLQQSAEDFKNLRCTSFVSYHTARNIIPASDKIHYIATRPLPYTFEEEITNFICEGYTVTFVALQLAYYMGFKRVFLVGVDHNFSVHGSPNELQFLKGQDPNHFNPEYFKDQEWHLPDLEASELSYRMADFFYTRAGRHVFDATVGGKLNIFPKICLEEALSLCKPKGCMK